MNQIRQEERKLMVDGMLYNERQVVEMFDPGRTSKKDLDPRQRAAVELVGRVSPKGRVLDVGCYVGTFVAALVAAYPKVDPLGVDSYGDNIRIAKLVHPELGDRFEDQSVYDLSFASESFDCVTFLEVIEHLDRPVDSIRELNRVLLTGGHLILSTPNASSLPNLFGSVARGYTNLVASALKRPHRLGVRVYFDNVDWNRHLIEFLPSSLNTLLALNGFDLVEHRFLPSRGLSWPVQFLVPGLSHEQIFLARKVRAAGTEII